MEITYEGYWYKYEHKVAKDGVDICLATTDPEKFCNGYYLYSDKDPGSGKCFVIVDTNNPDCKLLLIEKDLNQKTHR